MYKKILKISLILLTLNMLFLPASARVLELSTAGPSVEKAPNAQVFKPSRLMIGSETGFVIKAEPGCSVSLALAADENGRELLGEANGIVGDNGIIELFVQIPDNQDLVNRIVYFEVVAWKKKDYSDLAHASIVGIDGRSTGSNALIISAKPKKGFMPGFGPTVPGVGDVSRTVEALQDRRAAEEAGEDYLDDTYILNQPVILRNIRAPELE